VADALVGRRVGCTIAPSFAMAEFLTGELRIPENRLRVVHNGVAIPPRCKQVDRVRTFTTAGTFAPCKAMPLLVQTFLTVASHRPGVRLRMIGDGPDRRRCEHIASGGRGGGDVEFTGFTTDVDAQLEQGDAFVLPSLNENLPLALLRAMAMGLPCIAADVGGIGEALTQDCGILIAPGSSESLLMAMTRLIDQPALAGALGAASRQRIADRFSLARCADSHLELWSELLWARRSPRSAVGA